MKLIVVFLFLLFSNALFSQYEFKDEIKIPCTNVKDQQKTGTCWSFSTSSFLESELIRMGKGPVDLSDLYNVRMMYVEKAKNYVLRQGKANFGEGGLAHDVLNSANLYGLVPQQAYSGLPLGENRLNDIELKTGMKGFLDAVIETGKPGKNWLNALNGILDAYMGPGPSTFEIDGKKYTPQSYFNSLGINIHDYISIASFTHHPFYQNFILEIPDNFSNGSYFNVTLDEMMDVVNTALEKGYSLAWDGDDSETGFSTRYGIAILPINEKDDDIFSKPVKEVVVTQENRQENFMDYQTTDDHMMQVVGRAKDTNGTVYYIIKNSWGEYGPYKGFLYMSESYFRMKTLSVTVNKGALPESIVKKM